MWALRRDLGAYAKTMGEANVFIGPRPVSLSLALAGAFLLCIFRVS